MTKPTQIGTELDLTELASISGAGDDDWDILYDQDNASTGDTPNRSAQSAGPPDPPGVGNGGPLYSSGPLYSGPGPSIYVCTHWWCQ
jgi:hypothetical protein